MRHATAHSRFQITTDGFAPYRSAISNTLHDRCDFAQLINVYRSPQDGEKRYIPAEVASVEWSQLWAILTPNGFALRLSNDPICLRMGLRRFTRLTNAFSRKWENHWAAVCLWYAYYKSLRVTPAMEAEIAGHVWEKAELLA